MPAEGSNIAESGTSPSSNFRSATLYIVKPMKMQRVTPVRCLNGATLRICLTECCVRRALQLVTLTLPIPTWNHLAMRRSGRPFCTISALTLSTCALMTNCRVSALELLFCDGNCWAVPLDGRPGLLMAVFQFWSATRRKYAWKARKCTCTCMVFGGVRSTGCNSASCLPCSSYASSSIFPICSRFLSLARIRQSKASCTLTSICNSWSRLLTEAFAPTLRVSMPAASFEGATLPAAAWTLSASVKAKSSMAKRMYSSRNFAFLLSSWGSKCAFGISHTMQTPRTACCHHAHTASCRRKLTSRLAALGGHDDEADGLSRTCALRSMYLWMGSRGLERNSLSLLKNAFAWDNNALTLCTCAESTDTSSG
mmetsp:Transcript_82112/g.228879  ORF Transcript_82112/g.228879 Transcript_82112/m.228879 type:complete len:368 (+) Transcript_82112:1267-2370(+)